jgi:hypothetical protein
MTQAGNLNLFMVISYKKLLMLPVVWVQNLISHHEGKHSPTEQRAKWSIWTEE